MVAKASDSASIDSASASPGGQLLAKREMTESSFGSTIPRADGSNFFPRFQMMRKWFDKSNAKHECLYWATILTGFLQLGIKIASLIIFCEIDDSETPMKPVWIVFTSINILFLCLVLLIYLVRRHYHRGRRWFSTYFSARDSDDTEKLLKSDNEPRHKSFQSGSLLSRLEFLVNVVLTTFIVVTSVVFLANASSHILTLPTYSTRAAVSVGFEATDCALAVVFFVFDMLYECMSFAMVSQALAMLITVLNFLVCVVCIWANEYARIYNSLNWDGSLSDLKSVLSHVRAFSYFGIVVAFASGVGFVSSMALDATNRLSDIGSTLSTTYLLAEFAALIIGIVYFSMSCQNIHLFLSYQWALRNVLIANICCASAAMLLSFFGILAMMKVRQRPMTDLKVEEYDLNKLSEEQLAVWIRLIDTYHKQEGKNPDTAAGFEAISLFKAYINSPMPHMNCRVLRVFDAGAKAYEKIRAWDNLDNHAAFDADEASLINDKEVLINNSTDGDSKAQGQGGGGLSKNAAKRAKLKAAKKAAKRGDSAAATNVHEQLQQSPEEIRRDTQFRNDLISTEALVLLTCIEDYDLLSAVKSTWYGKILSKLIGAESPLKLTCIRFGLLATHWPFRQSMVFTSHTRKPNARAAAVCRAIASYNCALPKNKRCTMILNPTVAHLGMEQVLKPSGWLSVPLPPSHVVDLRPYKKYTLNEYLKKIKYRDQSKAFKRANGEVIETTDFNEINCSKAISLWWNIASKRTADGNTSVLANPTVEFLESLGSVSNEKGSRSLLFLKVDGNVIASAVLFRLGDTITSDIQGLDHENARQYNAYFVMMQETIQIALKSGLKFVDFGPTTSQPKMAIGSQEVEIYGGIFVRAPLSWFVTIFSGSVHVDE